MKIPGLSEAVATTASSEYVTPLELKQSGDPAPCIAKQAWVDAFGNLIIKTSIESSVLIPRENWDVLTKLISFASKRL